jgi:hypothetical protein
MNSLPNRDWTRGYRFSTILVHKSVITKLPLEFYENLYNWIITTDITNDKSGRFLEWTWHIFWDIYPNYKLEEVFFIKHHKYLLLILLMLSNLKY